MSHCDVTLFEDKSSAVRIPMSTRCGPCSHVHQEDRTLISLPLCDSCEDSWLWLGDAPGGGGGDCGGCGFGE